MYVHSIGPFTWHKQTVSEDSPRFQRGFEHETQEPYRAGRSIVLRIRKGKGIAVGVWRKEKDPDDALAAAMRANLSSKRCDIARENRWLEAPGPGQGHPGG